MLLKIPFIVSQLVAFHVMFTPPNRAPSTKEQIKHHHWSERYLNIMLTLRWLDYVKAAFWLAGLAEIAVILANHYAYHSASSFVLEHLLFSAVSGSKNGDTIGLTVPAVIGSILVTAGGVIRAWCYRSLDRFFTFELSIRSKHSLVTTGPYAFVRHPSYSALFVGALGCVLVVFGHGGWVRESGVLSIAVGKVAAGLWILEVAFITHLLILYRVEREDNMLRETFGEEWDNWAKRVPWKLMPGVV